MAIAIKLDGTLAAWGSETEIIDDLHTQTNVKSTTAGSSSAFVRFKDGTHRVLAKYSSNLSKLTPPFSTRSVTSVSSNSSKSTYLDYSGNLTNLGGNYTSISTPSNISGALDLAGSRGALYIVNGDKTITAYGWPYDTNAASQLTGTSNLKQIEGNYDNVVGLTEDGTIIVSPNNRFINFIPGGLEPAADIALAGFHGYAIHNDGTLSSLGLYANFYPAPPLSGVKKLSCNWYSALAIGSDSLLSTWKITSPATLIPLPQTIGPCLDVAGVGAYNFYAIQDNGNLISFSINSPSSYTTISGAENLVQIESCISSAIGRTADGSVILLHGTTVTPLTHLSNIVNVTAGENYYAALEADGTFHVWGREFTPTIDTPTDVQFSQITAGGGHHLGINLENQVFVWGYDSFGLAAPPSDLGLVNQVSAGSGFSLALLQDGSITSWGDYTNSGYSVPLGLAQVAQISAGSSHATALHEDDTVTIWGDNTYDQLNKPADLPAISQISCGENHTLALSKVDGKVYAWGHNDKGQTDVPVSLINVQKIVAGKDHSCALLADGSVVAWGYDYYGQTTVPAWIGAVTDISAGAFSDRTFYQFGEDGTETYDSMLSDFDAHGFTDDALSPNASPYGDGTPNLLKWASNVDLNETSNLTLHSNSNTSGIPLTTSQQGAQETTFTFEFIRRNKSSLVYIPEISYDLISYYPANGIESVESIDSEWERVSLEHTLETDDHAQVFGRVKVSLP